MARPKKVIDYSLVEKLAHIQCTQAEIAEVVDVSVKTLQRDREFRRIYEKGMHSGKMSLRRQQWKAAERGNTTMLIWLGKQYLNQKDDADLNEIRKQEMELKKLELQQRNAPPAAPDLSGFVAALKADIHEVFADETE